MAGLRSIEQGSRVGILGGTFDPVHNGHLAAARAVGQKLKLDTLLFIPAVRPPHKPDYAITPFESRVSMLEMVTAGQPGWSVSRIEKERSGPSYTIDTLVQLNQEFKGLDYYFIIGMDAFADIFTWKRYDQLLKFTNLVVVNRPFSTFERSGPVLARYFPQLIFEANSGLWQPQGDGGCIYFLEMEGVEASSRLVRGLVKSGGDFRGHLPGVVADYIEQYGLYQKSEVRRQKTEDRMEE